MKFFIILKAEDIINGNFSTNERVRVRERIDTDYSLLICPSATSTPRTFLTPISCHSFYGVPSVNRRHELSSVGYCFEGGDEFKVGKVTQSRYRPVVAQRVPGI